MNRRRPKLSVADRDDLRRLLRNAIAERNAALSNIDDLNQDCVDLQHIIVGLSAALGEPVDASITEKQTNGRPSVAAKIRTALAVSGRPKGKKR